MKKNIPQQKGFVILFAILISVIILLLGMGIFSVATKESILSSSAREAQYAFAAADTGSECALHAEYRGFFTTPAPQNNFVCANESVSWDTTSSTIDEYIEIDGTTTCAHVTIVTNVNSTRTIKSQGYNLCNGDQPQTGNPRLVERDLEITYAIPGSGGPGGGNPGTGTGGGSNPGPSSGIPSSGNPGSGVPGTGQSGGNPLGTSPSSGTITGSNQQPMQMQVQSPQNLVIQNPISTPSASTAPIATSASAQRTTSTAANVASRIVDATTSAIDSAFRFIENAIR